MILQLHPRKEIVAEPEAGRKAKQEDKIDKSKI